MVLPKKDCYVFVLPHYEIFLWCIMDGHNVSYHECEGY